MLSRCQIERIDTLDDDWDEVVFYRVTESDGELVDCWLPGIEPPDPYGPLDRGGFSERTDARAFALGIDRERALHGLLPGITVAHVDELRQGLDGAQWQNRERPQPAQDDRPYQRTG